MSLIAEARLVLTDDLVRESLRRNKAAARASGEGEGVAAGDVAVDDIADDDTAA